MRRVKTFVVAVLLAVALTQSKVEAIDWYHVHFVCTLETWRQAEEALGYWAALVWWYGHGCWDVG